MTPEPAELLALATPIAREAADLITRMRHEGVDVAATKSSEVDVVTAADRACEELVRERIARVRPEDAIIGEEGADHGGASGVRWIVDPIDGTVNYLYGLPDHCVSIGVAVGEQVVAGVVVRPGAEGQVEYAATLGGGATRNGQPLRVRPVVPLGQMLVATGFGYDATLRSAQGAAVARLLPRVRDIRRRGSCALDLCAVADGTVDAYVEEGPHSWDHAAGGLIASEAGAVFVLLPSPRGADVVCCTTHEGGADFLALLRECGFTA